MPSMHVPAASLAAPAWPRDTHTRELQSRAHGHLLESAGHAMGSTQHGSLIAGRSACWAGMSQALAWQSLSNCRAAGHKRDGRLPMHART